ncbi:Glycerol-3-phosphate regulon repressor [Gemmata sp. SH-PL17]|uniref:DeoR/GlpR family DNA-binding transcription regulator n=1 Tax=Gemmata sp. SH-PL17 TaxID=1630693 RepID=UPI00078CEA5E|nr:DeoR/GlpR family DNA-binding transcription regulator [Gemmata sp. SH-PL17]AMV22919.1 Glycerol-3-phosphate regulon repressor [Gemmata sp. SH-PL17]
MTPKERRTQIVALVDSGEPSTPADLAARFGVSEDSIRRDLRALAEHGLVRRVHGGALPRSPAAVPYGERLEQQPAVKQRIAARTAGRLASLRAVCLDGGTTVLEVARLLPPEFRGTVVTVSLPVATELAARAEIEVIQIGGRVSGFSHTVVGPDVVEALRRYRFDVCVLGVCSLDPQAGLTVPDRDEAFVKAIMVERSASVVAVATRTKLGTAEPFLVAPATAVGTLVTDADPNEPLVTALTEIGVEVVCVPTA